MCKLISCLLSACVFFGLAQVSQAGLVITEVMYKPSGTNGGTSNSDEWFEVFNSGYGSLNLGNIKYDDDADASDGVLLSAAPLSLAAGQSVIIANKTQSQWEARYGAKPSGSLFLTPAGNWNPLNDNFDTMTLYNTVTSSQIFTMTYNNIAVPNGVSIYYSGTNPALIGNANPFVNAPGSWQTSPTAFGPATDKHSAGTTPSLQSSAAPEPAAWALMIMATLGLSIAVSRQRRDSAVQVA